VQKQCPDLLIIGRYTDVKPRKFSSQIIQAGLDIPPALIPRRQLNRADVPKLAPSDLQPPPSSDAYESAPYRRKNGADQNVDRILAERTAVSAHLNTKTADLVMAGGIEQPCQDSQNCGDEVHQTPSHPCNGPRYQRRLYQAAAFLEVLSDDGALDSSIMRSSVEAPTSHMARLMSASTRLAALDK
jgi:hypothetical protein